MRRRGSGSGTVHGTGGGVRVAVGPSEFKAARLPARRECRSGSFRMPGKSVAEVPQNGLLFAVQTFVESRENPWILVEYAA